MDQNAGELARGTAQRGLEYQLPPPQERRRMDLCAVGVKPAPAYAQTILELNADRLAAGRRERRQRGRYFAGVRPKKPGSTSTEFCCCMPRNHS